MFTDFGETVVNDHIAFRTFNDPRINIDVLSQALVEDLINRIPKTRLKSPDFIFSGNLWGKPSFRLYQMLRNESEYAAWVYVFGIRANHFTVSINALRKH